ncbi:hypothetical protein ACF0H5_005330 [Mactra antiquata]
MKYLLLITFMFGSAHCLLDDIIPKVINNTDTNGDGFISLTELSAQMLSFDADANGIVTKHEFTEGWIAAYDDNHPDTNTFFNNLDINDDHYLTDADMQEHKRLNNIIVDENDLITYADFETFIRNMHPGHGNHEP